MNAGRGTTALTPRGRIRGGCKTDPPHWTPSDDGYSASSFVPSACETATGPSAGTRHRVSARRMELPGAGPPGDSIVGEVEVLEVRRDKPITRLRTIVTRQDGVVALEGTALCYTVSLGA